MKVHLVRKETITDYVKTNARSKSSLDDWQAVVKAADWEKPDDIKATFNSADLLGNGTNRVVFDIAGNNYRMICAYAFGERMVHLFIKWIGTHAEYDKLNAKNEQYTVEMF